MNIHRNSFFFLCIAVSPSNSIHFSVHLYDALEYLPLILFTSLFIYVTILASLSKTTKVTSRIEALQINENYQWQHYHPYLLFSPADHHPLVDAHHFPRLWTPQTYLLFSLKQLKNARVLFQFSDEPSQRETSHTLLTTESYYYHTMEPPFL